MGRPAEAWHLNSRLRVKHLMLLAELGDVGNLRRAATHLHMTQPAASSLLKEAEGAFGTQLFTRTRRGVIPNDAGIIAIQRARLLLRDLEATREELEAVARGATGKVRVGTFAVAAPVLVPLTLARLWAENPKLLVAIEEGPEDWLLPALARNDLDCVIGRLPENIPDGIRWSPLYEEAVAVVAAAGHPIFSSPELDLCGLAQFDWILPASNSPVRRCWEAMFTAAGIAHPKPILESVSVLTNLSCIQRDQVLSLMPEVTARHLAELGALRIVPFSISVPLPPIVCLVRFGTENLNALNCFLRALSETADQMDASGG